MGITDRHSVERMGSGPSSPAHTSPSAEAPPPPKESVSRDFSIRSSSRSIVSFVLAGLLLAAVLVVPASAGAVDRPPFCETPSPLPAGGPGTLLRSERYGFKGVTRPAAGTTGWRVLYKS